MSALRNNPTISLMVDAPHNDGFEDNAEVRVSSESDALIVDRRTLADIAMEAAYESVPRITADEVKNMIRRIMRGLNVL